jgi:hypothetical protein
MNNPTLMALLVVFIAGIGYHFGFQAAESDYNQRLAQQNQLAAQQIDAAAHAFIAQQQQANTASAELEQVKAKLTNTAKTLQQRNQANAKLNPNNAANCLSDYDLSLYNDAITFDRLPMLPAAVPSQLIAPPSTTDIIANHIDNSLRCTAIEAQLNQLITVIEQQQNKETP